MYILLYLIRMFLAIGLLIAVPALLLGVTNAGGDREVARLLALGSVVYLVVCFVMLWWVPRRMRQLVISQARSAASAAGVQPDVETVSELLNRYAGLDRQKRSILVLDRQTGFQQAFPIEQLQGWDIIGKRSPMLYLWFDSTSGKERTPFALQIRGTQVVGWENALRAVGA
ncbi:hypothetical protein [Achromobacter insuavis]|uniref:hypothetical protein n=1 Tax=Achromobacter insuavis TaxID=1287735 RepID=UPI001F13848D|nr:hypothetical protein [Achromobacter insuavis]